jgi:hypothetical protein
MNEATMLYKKGSELKTELGLFDYTIVDASDIPEAKKQGWHLTQAEAISEKPKRTNSKVNTDAEEA